MSESNWKDLNRVHASVTEQLSAGESATITRQDWDTIMDCIADIVRLGDDIDAINEKIASEKSMAEMVVEWGEKELLRMAEAEGSPQ